MITNANYEFEYKFILNKLTRLRQLAIVKLAILLPLTFEELIGLKYEDIKWTKGKSKTILISRCISYYGIDDAFDFYVTNYEQRNCREINLPKKAVDIINWLSLNETKNKLKCFRIYTNDYNGYICVNKHGKLFQPIILKRYLKTLIFKAMKEKMQTN